LFCLGGIILEKFKPFIGVTPGFNYKKEKLYIKNGYMQGIIEAGGVPVLIPVTEDETILGEIVERLDGFLITGGPDIDAKYFGEQNMPYNGEISPYRDLLEIEITRKALEANKPVFGICRGIQVMNAAMGGTLYQDIGKQVGGDVLKHSQAAPVWYPTHDINIDAGSKVWYSFGRDTVRVNTFHHQAIKDVAPGFAATSRTADGIIESIEHQKHVFAVGVQWHPELMWQEDRMFLKLFEDFVAASLLPILL